MSVGISVKGVKPFDGTNFQGWKAQINALFVMNEVLDVVDGTRPAPAAGDQHAAENKKFVKDDATAKFIILSNLDEPQQMCVLSYATAKEMWDKLNLIHEQKTETNKMRLLQRFHAYQMSEGDTAVQDVAKITNMASQLKDIGEEVSNATKMAKILASLTSKFSTLKIAWDSVDPDRQTMDNLQERLIQEDMRLSMEEDAASALVATKKERYKKKPRSVTKKEIECYKCHKMGHFAWECKNVRRRKDGDKEFRDCTFVVEVDAKPSRSSVKRVSSNRAESTCKQIRELMAAGQSEVWLIDSGASRHLTYRREWFTDY